jgi:hypothetical protein
MANEIQKLKNINASTYPENKLRDLVKHLQDHMNSTYVYWVGEWAGSKKIRSTRDGKFVSKQEVINYLNNV